VIKIVHAMSIAAALACNSIAGLASPAAAQTAASVAVNAGSGLATIPGPAWGLNTAVWDGNLLDSGVPRLLSNAGVTALRYPGGSTSDVYNWQSNSIVPGQGNYANPNDNFDAFMGLVKSIGATPIITVNYGSNAAGAGGGDPGFAAAWVQYANITKGYGVKYWEIGNEIYGNGEYGASWETDLHAAHDPATYGKNVAQFAAAMKAVDPSIKIGAVLAAPGNWPDGQSPNWNSNVLAQCGSAIDFVIVHWYPQNPGSESDSGLLAAPQNGTTGIAAMAAKLKSLISQYGGAKAANIQIMVTETNSVSSDPGKQTLSIVNAMFIADAMLSWVENGATSVDVWDLHNGAVAGNSSPSLFGSATYGDYGVLSNGSSEPAADTPFPTYYGLQMVSLLGKAGDALVATSSSNSLLTTHAVRQANGNLALILINKDVNNTVTANVSLSGFNPSGTGTVYSYTPTSNGVTSKNVSGEGTSFSIAAPPYSLTTIVLAGTSTPPSPGFILSTSPTSLSVAQGASGAATISVTPSGGFNGNVAFALNGAPAGVTATFNPASSATSTSLTLSPGPSAPVGTSIFTITGTSGALSATTALALTVSGAGTPPGPGPATFAGKASTNSPWFDEEDVVLSTTAPITALTLTITVPATNVSYNGSYNTFGGQIVDGYTVGSNLVYSFTLSPGQTIGAGAFTFAAEMNGNGATHDVTGDSWTATYTSGGATYTQSGKFGGASPPPPPPSPNFTLSSNPTTLSIVQGGSGAATISITPTGRFNGNVAFALNGAPVGVTATFNPASATTSASLTLAANGSAPVGTSNLTITGTSGGLSATTPLALTINGSGTPPGTGPATFLGKASTNSPWFDEDDVVLSTTAPITALTVTIAMPATNVSYNGVYNTFGGQIVNSFTGGANLLYSFTLSPGQAIGTGSVTFAAQMNGNGALHDVTGDSWTATYTSGGATYTQSGKF
jgi:hypothetical protein